MQKTLTSNQIMFCHFRITSTIHSETKRWYSNLIITFCKMICRYGNLFNNFTFCSFEDGKSDKEILDDLLKNTRYDKRLLPPVTGQYNYSH